MAGNFGVVTSFEYRLHHVGPLVNLGLFFSGTTKAATLLRFAREFACAACRDAAMFIAGLNAPPEPFVPEEYRFMPGYALVVVGLGCADAPRELVAPVRDAPWPLFKLVTPIPYVNLQQMFDPAAPWGILGYEKAVYLDDLSDGAIDVIAEYQPRSCRGCHSPRFSPSAAPSGRWPRMPLHSAAAVYPVVVNVAALRRLCRISKPTVRGCALTGLLWCRTRLGKGSYVNFMSEYDEPCAVRIWAVKYDRLARSRRYDPDNVFHLNANILPAKR